MIFISFLSIGRVLVHWVTTVVTFPLNNTELHQSSQYTTASTMGGKLDDLSYNVTKMHF